MVWFSTRKMAREALVDPSEPGRLRRAKTRLGRKPQVGGALAILIGVLVWFATPPASPGDPISLHHLAALFLIIGLALLVTGTLVRWFYLD